jgi:hypothetical protein
LADENNYDLIKNPKGKSTVWQFFSIKRKRETHESIDYFATDAVLQSNVVGVLQIYERTWNSITK